MKPWQRSKPKNSDESINSNGLGGQDSGDHPSDSESAYSGGAFADGSGSQIGRHLLRLALIYGLGFIVLSFLVSMLLAFVRERGQLAETLERIRESEVAAVSEALWVANTEMLETQLLGLIRSDFISRGEVFESENSLVTAGVAPPGGSRIEEFPLTFTYDGEERRIGTLRLTITSGHLLAATLVSGLVGSLYPTLAILAVGTLIYLSFHRIVIRRIIEISTYLHAFDPNFEPRELRLNGKRASRRSEDELDEVAGAINTLRERLNDRHRKLDEAYRRVELEVEEKTRELELTNRTLKRQLDDLRRTEAELKKADEARTLFLANMSHELRTPITGIVGIASLLEGTEMGREQREYLASIRDSGRSLLEIVEDLLDFGRLAANKIRISDESFDLPGAVQAVVTLLEPTAERQECEVNLHLTAEVPRRVRGDMVRLQQVLRNLLSNALKFSPGGRIEIDVRRVEGAAEEGAPERETADGAELVLFSVRDNGEGIPEEAQSHLFESFYQADSSFAKEHGGSGLGLAICRRLVELMGGEIWLESKLGEGSIFSFQIPFTAQDSTVSETEEPKGDATLEPSSPGRSLRILLAEDNAINRLYMERFLAGEGHQVTAVADGQGVLDAFSLSEYDLILMDIQMPGLDGLETTRRLREFTSVPIVALTAYARPAEVEAFVAEGMDGAVTKPINEAELRRTIYAFGRRR